MKRPERTGSRPSKAPAAILALIVLGACAAPQGREVSRAAPIGLELPAMKVPVGGPATPTNRSNGSLAQEFMHLAFQLESGRKLPVLTRFEGPITLRLTGQTPGRVSERDLDSLLQRLRREAGIRIDRAAQDNSASITIEFVPGATMKRAVPNAACFVVPGITNWRDFSRGKVRGERDWAALATRTQVAIFIPSDASPQEVRDCMHEEIAQALGPVNDLYHLTDSIFNDDNFHTVLTGFDMMILRAYYDPSLRSGMSPEAVAARLPGIFARINPRGQRGGAVSAPRPTPRGWITEITMALGPGAGSGRKLAAARRAVEIARDQGWNDNRLGFSLYAQGRLALGSDTRLALQSFALAENVFRADPNTRLHAAHVAVQSAAYALSSGRPDQAIRIADENSPVALAFENASLLSTLLLIKAQALDAMNRQSEARIVRLDALGWARYGMGSEAEIRKRLGEIAALSPRPKRSTS